MSSIREGLKKAQSTDKGKASGSYSDVSMDLFAGESDFQIAGSDQTIVRNDDGTYQYGQFRLTPTSVVFPDEPEEDEAEALMRYLLEISSRIQFWIGDLALLWIPELADNLVIGKAYDDLASRFGLDSSSALRDYCWVCRKVSPSTRRDGLSFSHHKIVAPMEDDDQNRWLAEAESNGWSVATLRKKIKGGSEKKKPALFDTIITRQESVLGKAHKLDRNKRVQLARYLRDMADKIEGM